MQLCELCLHRHSSPLILGHSIPGVIVGFKARFTNMWLCKLRFHLNWLLCLHFMREKASCTFFLNAEGGKLHVLLHHVISLNRKCAVFLDAWRCLYEWMPAHRVCKVAMWFGCGCRNRCNLHAVPHPQPPAQVWTKANISLQVYA